MIENAMIQINKLRGVPEFKALANGMCTLSKNRKKLPDARIQLPNFMFVEDPGCGVTTHIKLLTELIFELKLLPFAGDRKFFEWVIDSNAFEPKGSFDRLLHRTNEMAGFRNNFCGVIGLDIDSWFKYHDDHKFDRLIDFVTDVNDHIVFIFVIKRHRDDDVQRLVNRLSMSMPLEVVHCALPNDEEMAYYLRDTLRRRGFLMSDPAMDYVKSIMPKLRNAEGYDGFQTLSKIADTIIYNSCKSEEINAPVIDTDDISFIGEPGGYADRFKPKAHDGRPIGFN